MPRANCSAYSIAHDLFLKHENIHEDYWCVAILVSMHDVFKQYLRAKTPVYLFEPWQAMTSTADLGRETWTEQTTHSVGRVNISLSKRHVCGGNTTEIVSMCPYYTHLINLQ